MTDRVKFWFDPVSPWCWAAARWIQTVENCRDIELSFHIMSLAILNEGKELSEPVRGIVANSWPYLRVLAAVEASAGQHGLRALYNAIGTRIHEESVRSTPNEVLAASLKACELDEGLIAHADDSTHDAHIASSHRARCDDETDSGAPTIRINDNSFFGPALSRVPGADDAGQLFDAIAALIRYPYVFEFQRPRTERPVFSVQSR